MKIRKAIGALFVLGAFGAPAGVALAGTAFAGTAAGASPAATGTAPERIELDYEAYLGGFHILSARAVLKRDESSYRIEALGRARGILDWFSGWRGNALSTGRIAVAEGGAENSTTPTAAVLPARHRHEGVWSDEPRWAALTYGPDGALMDIRQSELEEPDELSPIPEGSTTGSIDPLSAVIAVSLGLEAGRGCSAELPIFDGRRRYDLTLMDRGRKRIERNAYTIFNGEALRCGVEVARIGGFRDPDDRYVSDPRERTIYIAQPLAGLPPVPVRVHAETELGQFMMHLTAVRTGGEEVALEPGADNLAD